MESITPKNQTLTPPLHRQKRKVGSIADLKKDQPIDTKIRIYDSAALKEILFINKTASAEEIAILKEKLSKNDFLNPFVISIAKSFHFLKKQKSFKYISILIDSLRSFLRFSNSVGAKDLRMEMKSALTYLSNSGIIHKSENLKKYTQINFKNEAMGINEKDGACACASIVLSAIVAFHKKEPYNVEKILTEGVLRHRRLNHPHKYCKSSITQVFGPTNPDIQLLSNIKSEIPSARNYPWIRRIYSILESIKASTEGLLCYEEHCIMCKILSDKKVELFESERSFAPSTISNILEEDVDDSLLVEKSEDPKYKIEASDGAYHIICENTFAAALFLSAHSGLTYIRSVNTCIRFFPVKVILPSTKTPIIT